MKNHSLSVQIWIVFITITLAISILLSFILPWTLRGFFTKEIYATINSAQDLMFNRFEENTLEEDVLGTDKLQDIRTVKHFLIYGRNQVILNSPITVDFLEQVKNEINVQNKVSQQYSGKIGREKVFYVITKGEAFEREAFLVSYMGDAYREDLVNTLFRRLLLLMTIIILLSWIPALLLSKYLSKPLVNLEKRVYRLANNEWNEPIDLKRKDEIGKLGKSIDELRKQLIRQDEAEQSFLQHVSHELKTPVMVIRSFTQAIKDGIYPKGDLNSSISVIDEEAERLEKKIRNLLYLTKLDYLSNHDINMDNFFLDNLIREVVDRLNLSRKDLDWNLELPSVKIHGDMEQWRIVIENLIDNQIRYANTEISVKLIEDNSKITLRIWNNGPHIEQSLLENLFKEYNKGYKGEFGLGLAIVKRILDIHAATIFAKNEEDGVSFYIEIKNS